MHLPDAVAEALGSVAYVFAELQPYLPTYAHLIASALFPIYAGAHASLSRPSSAARPLSKKRRADGSGSDDDDENEDEEDEVVRMEGLSPTDAVVFPILAGCTLAGLYFLIKWLQDPAILNKILNWYFATFSVFAVARLVSDALNVLHSLVFPRQFVARGVLYKFDIRRRQARSAKQSNKLSPLPGILSRIPMAASVNELLWRYRILPSRKMTVIALVRNVFELDMKFGIYDLFGLATGLTSVVYYNFVDKPWYLTNLMGFGFAYGALQLLSPTTFWTGTLILCALFFYDIYFVFFTPMMVTVAKTLDVPIKLLFPRPPPPDAPPNEQAMSMLGLGDVVLPGIMIGLALRFDLYLFYLRAQQKTQGRDMTTAQNDEKPSSQVEVDDDTATETSTIKAPYESVAASVGDRFWSGGVLDLMRTFPKSDVRGSFPKPFFHVSLAGYVCGMCVTLIAMQVSNHPQPALLYLVPGVLLSLWLYAFFSGQMQEFWAFSDAGEDEDDDAEKEKKRQKEKGKRDEKLARKAAGESVEDATKEAADEVSAEGQNGDVAKKPATDDKADDDEGKKHEKPKKRNDLAARVLFGFQVLAPSPLKAPPASEMPSTATGGASATGTVSDGEPAEKRRRVV